MARSAQKPVPLPTRHREDQLSGQGFGCIAGVDEAGVGPLAGPVVAAAVILPPDFPCLGVRDSKLIDEAERCDLERHILGSCVASAIGQASVAEIDAINIYHASALAMRRAVEALPLRPDYLMIDARRVDLDLPQEGPVRGDAEHTCIAAASILAKQFRDRLMVELDRAFPAYGFAGHKGYPTPQHVAALSRHGVSPAHRCSWLAVREAAGLLPRLYYQLAEQLRAATEAEQLERMRHSLAEARRVLAEEEYLRLRELLKRRLRPAPRRRGGTASRQEASANAASSVAPIEEMPERA